ncbi:MAG: OpgC domain-containing protein [Azospirillaceae bacterium]
MSAPSTDAGGPVAGLRGRDPRVDFFRGLAFIIILIAHIPSNWVAQWIPARFGLSDATEMFVFMSGYAAGIAFGGTFLRHGFTLGTARVAQRVWQVYLGHLLLFFFVAMSMAAANQLFETRDYIAQLNLWFFFNETAAALVGFFTLSYVPNYFDILPMYIVILLMMPAVFALARLHPLAAIAACIGIYLANWFVGFDLPAEVRPGSDRAWFFNPFGWQLIFFTGLALSMGWLRPPPVSRLLIGLAVLVLVAGLLLGHWPLWRSSELLTTLREAISPWLNKTDFGILRYVHFLAAAYLVVVLLKGREHWLSSRFGRPVMQCGKQSLPVFLFAMAISRYAGIVLDHTDREPWQAILVNAGAIAVLISIAYLIGFLKKEPWRQRKQPAGGSATTGTVSPRSPGGRAQPAE